MYKGDPDVDDPYEDTVEKKFLAMDFISDRDLISTNGSRYPEGSQPHRVPFRFIIPDHQIPPHRERESASAAFLQLPPSLRGGSEFVDNSNSKVYMQPLVQYTLHANLIAHRYSSHSVLPFKLDSTVEIQICPRSGCQPPTAVDDFPGEFQLTSVRRIRQHPLWGRTLGGMTITTTEPPPVVIGTSNATAQATSQCKITLIFKPRNPTKAAIPPLGLLRGIIRAQLHIKTYYSTQTFQQVPQRPPLRTQTRTLPSSAFRLRSEFLELGTYRVQITHWEFASPSAASNSTSPGTSCKFGAEWASSICLPIHTPAGIVPTFASSFAVRSYCLRLNIVLNGLSHKPFELESPLQIIYENREGCSAGFSLP
ncbi:uncharacterized protein APUU_41458S [Aspergillus puulaauensis]|uniref:Arrestin-like N-terminal domain-containing protein n=1 Tax=Aspergillus puulaauensis TaxID=1220207 RepID=A0A7R8AMH9_9EURO|nr:uncharacterized protein APUU_41458S [Aspergillus puulaauensis]BCS25014.1 hypothetical protein APUU_41458S [Aspergillus puulaauensis]